MSDIDIYKDIGIKLRTLRNVSAFECGCQTKFDVAEYLDVTTAFLDDALKKYKERYGIVVKYKEYFIYFYPCIAVIKKDTALTSGIWRILG